MIGSVGSHTVHLDTRDEVIAEARSCIAQAKRGGGIVVGASNYFVPGTPVANVWALIETIRESR